MMPKIGDKIRFRDSWLRRSGSRAWLGRIIFEIIEVRDSTFLFRREGDKRVFTDSLDKFDQTFIIGEGVKPRYIYRRRASSFRPR